MIYCRLIYIIKYSSKKTCDGKSSCSIKTVSSVETLARHIQELGSDVNLCCRVTIYETHGIMCIFFSNIIVTDT